MEQVGIELLMPTNVAVGSLKFFSGAFTKTTSVVGFGANKMYGFINNSVKPFKKLYTESINFNSSLKRNLNTYESINAEISKYNELLDKQRIGSKEFLATQLKIADLEKRKSAGQDKPQIDVGSLVRSAVALTGIGLLISNVLSYIPEIGQVFGQIKDTIMQNIMQPIRKFVLPILVQMMNYVRDNRTAFVKIGSVIANVFRAVYSVASAFVNMVIGGFNKIFTAITGGKASVNGFVDYMNLVLLKIFFVFTFVQMLMEDAMDVIANAAIFAFKNVIIPVFTEFGNVISYVASLFTDPIAAIEKFDTTTQALAAGGLTILAGAIYSSLMPAIVAATSATWSFTAALLANPMTWLVVGVMAVVAAAVLLVKHWDKIKSTISSFWSNWGNWILTAISIIDPFIELPLLIWNNWDKLKTGLGNFFTSTGTKISTFFNKMNLWDKLKTKLTVFWANWGKWIKIGLALFAPFIGIPLLVYTNWETIMQKLTRLLDNIMPTITRVALAIRTKMKGAFDGIFNFGSGVFGGVVTAWNKMISTIKGVWTQFVEFVKGIGDSIKSAIESKINQWWNDFKETQLGKVISKGIESIAGTPSPVLQPSGFSGAGTSNNWSNQNIKIKQTFNVSGTNAGDIANKVNEKSQDGWRDVKNKADLKRGK